MRSRTAASSWSSTPPKAPRRSRIRNRSGRPPCSARSRITPPLPVVSPPPAASPPCGPAASRCGRCRITTASPSRTTPARFDNFRDVTGFLLQPVDELPQPLERRLVGYYTCHHRKRLAAALGLLRGARPSVVSLCQRLGDKGSGFRKCWKILQAPL